MTRSATVSFTLSAPANTNVRITRQDGSVVRTLMSATAQSGVVKLSWDRKDDRGRRVKAGTYLVVVDATTGGGSAQRSIAFTAG